MLAMRLLVLSLSVGAAELCDSDPAPAIQSRALLQKAVKERLYATGVDFTSRPIRHPTYSATDSGQSHIAADKAQGLITELPCGGFFKLNASYSLEATCPQDCPLQADPTSYSDKAPVADLAQGACRAAAVDGCEVPSADGTAPLAREGGGRTWQKAKRQCELAYLWALYALLAVLVLLVLLILAILGDLLLRPVTNEANLEDALDHRSKQKFRTPNYDGTGRHLYPLSTNLCSTIVGGPGLALHFRFQAALICWAAAICIGWVVLAFLVDNDLLVLGTKQFGTAFRNCVLVAWGRETQRRLMWVKESFLAIVYVCSFAGSIFFAILQRRFFSELDQQNDTMKDYALQVVGLPCLEGSERLEEELKANIEAAAAQPVVGVSVCWAYREHKETVHVEMMKALHRPRGQGPTHFRQPEQDMGLFRRVLFRLEQMVLSEGSEQAISEPELRELVGSMRSSSTAFAVFETEKARDEALRRLSSNGLGFRGHSLQVQKAQHEPQGIHWNNIDGVPFNDKLWRLAKGIGSILLCLLGWMIIFYAPYAWSILKFNYEGGRQPGVVYTLAFSLIVCVGNLLMAEICSRVADAMSFEFKDTRENCYMILYLIAIATNVGFDLWTTYFMATQLQHYEESNVLGYSVADAASAVVRQSTLVLGAAADELARQANAVAQITADSDPLAWITGEEEALAPLAPLPPPVAVPLAALTPWGWGDWREASSASSAGPFKVDHDINAKLSLWQGDLCSLEADALLTPVATGYVAGCSTVFGRVLAHGGQDLLEELMHLDTCRSGEARSCKAYNLPCQRLVLTVGPKYKDKYQVAAQNTLNTCYRECLKLLVELELKSVAIPCYWYSKGYPLEEQAHVALRSVRRCLEKLRRVEAVILVAANAQELELYEALMPLYFPRSAQEAQGASLLPDSCWTEWGEVAMEERRIRVSNHVISHSDEETDLLFEDEDKSFLHAREDADQAAMRRLEGTMIHAESLDEARHICLRYLRRSRELRALTEPARFVYYSGQDCFGRHVVVLLGARLPALGVQDEQTIPLFVKELEALSDSFVLLYVNSEVDSLDTSVLEVLQEMLAMIQARYRRRLAQLYVLHPGLWFRAAFAFGRAISDEAASVWHDSIYVDSIAELVSMLNATRLYLPDFVRYSEIMVGMDFRTESGVLLADVDNFLEKFESYALQRSMGQQLFEYAWPCTFIVPFVAEPCAVIFLFSRLFMLLIRSHPELKVWECRNWLAAIDLELGRYADCLVNVYLAVLVFFFPGGYTHWIFLYFTAAHAYIYAYDHYKVLRVVPRCTFSSSAVDSCAQVLLAPACGILLVAIIFKMNCLNGSAICYNEYQLLTVCFAGFAAHCVVHIFLLQFFVPLFGAEETKEYRKDARTYGDVAAAEPCSWFSANPMHCLRSKYVYEHSPPCTFFIAGLEHKMEVNESIGCFFKEKDESVEDAKSYFLAVPSFQEVYGFLRSRTSLTENAGDTGYRKRPGLPFGQTATFAAMFDLPCTRPMNQIRGFETETKEAQRARTTRDALRQLGARKDLLNLDSYLLDRPEVVNMPVQFDQGSLLHVAAMRGHQDMVQMLVHQRGADIERGNYAKQTSLHVACEGNFANLVVDLLAAGADADKRDQLKQTPLHRAAHFGSVDCILALLEYGANAKLRDEGGLMPVHTAALRGRDEALRVLISQDPSSANAVAADGWTPLHFASHGNFFMAVEALVECGALLQAVNKERQTALHRAVRSEAACQVLLRAGADLEAADHLRRLPIHLACEEGCVPVLRLFLEAGSPCDPLDAQRRTPLIIAARAGSLELCEALLQVGADPWGDLSKQLPSAVTIVRRGNNPALQSLVEDYARAAAAAASMPLEEKAGESRGTVTDA
ncbi:unnamed protein product [Effrenium voratum]|nr:unnamed protein product [Effrenium voratum]